MGWPSMRAGEPSASGGRATDCPVGMRVLRVEPSVRCSSFPLPGGGVGLSVEMTGVECLAATRARRERRDEMASCRVDNLTAMPLETAWGWSAVATRGGGIARCCLPMGSRSAALDAVCPDGAAAVASPGTCEVLDVAAGLLARYFAGERVSFDMPLDLTGLGAFGAAVLRACGEIGYGETCSYGELAVRAGRPRAARAVGQVMRRNPLAPLVPCHRVVGCTGALTGFGAGLEMKRRLLALEGG